MSGLDLRNARRDREWTQVELAHRLGVTQAYVCLLERNRRAVPRRLAQKLASVLKLSPSTLPMSAGRASLKPEEATAAPIIEEPQIDEHTSDLREQTKREMEDLDLDI